MNWKQSFLISSVLGQGINKDNPDEITQKCVQHAYRDMMTAGRFYCKKFKHSSEEICNKTLQLLKSHNYSNQREIIEQVASFICDVKIGDGNKYVTGYGLAQKLVNMSFKLLYVFSDLIFSDVNNPDFNQCDCPLDSIILKKAGLDKYTWSKITPDEYADCQTEIEKKLKMLNLDDELSKLGNLAFDFINW